MKLRQLFENGGLIVPGVNTTADVGPDEIKKQASKFGNKVDKQGKPLYTMHKKAHKNSDPNTLSNLGMAESRKEIWNEWKIMPDTIKPMGLIHKKGKGPNNRFDFKNKGNNKANEDEKDLSSASQIYVDMDGVLVDFFGPWTKMMGVSDWKEIKDVDAALQKIRDTKDFWINLKPTSNADNLLSIIKEIKGEYSILSAPMADDPRVEPSKKEWVEKNLSAFPPKEVIITAQKSKYAKNSDGTPNILIDDFGQNVSKWEASGGVGFKHKDHKFERTAKNLKQYFEQPATEGELIPLPQNSFSVDSDATDYDFMKLGRNMANIATTNKDDANMGDQDIMLNFFGGDVEAKHMIKNLKRLGYKVGDVSGYQDHNFDPEPTAGKEPPQVKSKDVDKFISRKGKTPLDKIKPVQRDRSWAKLGKALQRTGDKKYEPILVDRDGYIINGHHRYDSLRLRGQKEARVHMVNGSLKEIMQLMKR